MTIEVTYCFDICDMDIEAMANEINEGYDKQEVINGWLSDNCYGIEDDIVEKSRDEIFKIIKKVLDK